MGESEVGVLSAGRHGLLPGRPPHTQPLCPGFCHGSHPSQPQTQATPSFLVLSLRPAHTFVSGPLMKSSLTYPI